MVTAGTRHKTPHLNSAERLDYFAKMLFAQADEFGWRLLAWAILANHYHFIAASPPSADNLSRFIGKLHMTTAKQLNQWDNQPGRKVWFQYWDSHITYEKSFLVRLNYVHYNPAKHGATTNAAHYRWCSAAWFEQNAPRAFVASVKSFKTDRLTVPDDF